MVKNIFNISRYVSQGPYRPLSVITSLGKNGGKP
jgi:hypothetical protein